VILTRVFPPVPGAPAGDPIDLEVDGARDLLADLYRPPRENWLRLNLIGSVSGGATGTDGTSETLTNPADRVLLNVIRALSDVVLVGAASVRAEGYFVPRRAALAVVTGTGNLAAHRITTTGQRGPLLVLCPASAAEQARESLGEVAATIIVVADTGGRLAGADIVSALREAGYHSIVCEGGPSFAAQLLREGLVDEVCLSTSPKLNGAGVPLFGDAEFATLPLTLTQLMTDDASGIYARWALVGE
jgi:riboflavin biosynthesis pyrimidine reductase